MKKLVIAMSFLTPIILMSSCTADSIESSNNETLKNPNQVTFPANKSAIDGVNPPRPSTEVTQDVLVSPGLSTESPIDGVNPPRP